MKLLSFARKQGPIARDTLRTTTVLILRAVVQAGTLLVIARMLGPSQFGLFAGVTSFAILLGMLGTFGTHLVLLAERAKDQVTGELVAQWALPSTLISGGLLFFAYLTACQAVLIDHELSLYVLVCIGLSEIALQPVATLLTVDHQVLGHTARSQLLQILPAVLRFGAALGILASRPSDPLVVFAFCYLFASVSTLVLITTLTPFPWPAPHQWQLPTARNLRRSASYAVLNLTAAGPGELDKTLAARLIPGPDSGVYSAASRALAAGILPVLAMMLAAMPRLFREGHSPSRDSMLLLKNLYGIGLFYGFCAALLLWLFAPMFDWLFGPKFSGVESAIKLLCIAVPGMILRRINGTILMTRGKPWLRVLFEASGMAVLSVAALVIGTEFGMFGMLLAVIISEWTMAFMGGYLVLVHSTRAKGEARSETG